jgi:hypothetical protein
MTCRQGFDYVRQNIILALFQTNRIELQARLGLLHAASDQQRLRHELERDPLLAVNLIREQFAKNRTKFKVYMDCIWSSKKLYHLGYQVLDKLKPGWRKTLHQVLFANSTTGSNR